MHLSLTLGWGHLPFLHMNPPFVVTPMYLKTLFCIWKIPFIKASFTLWWGIDTHEYFLYICIYMENIHVHLFLNIPFMYMIIYYFFSFARENFQLQKCSSSYNKEWMHMNIPLYICIYLGLPVIQCNPELRWLVWCACISLQCVTYEWKCECICLLRTQEEHGSLCLLWDK